mmetsp:Transcript_156877/g.273034  ORF Transcript_156877/g.273034 Transcript_156877/m.273034 type:complete len:422 (+) Transcript_156877:1-1266(+)
MLGMMAEDVCSKIEGLTIDPVPIKKVGIIGSGLMGGGIGMCCAQVGIKVIMVDINPESLKKGMELIESNFKRSRRLSDEQKKEYLGNMSGTINMQDIADCDLIVEAVFESMDIKKDIFGKLDKICKPSAFLCSNTSFLSIDEIASATSRPDKVMGTHFFSPANVMKLLENVKGSKTSEVTIASMMHWGKQIGKACILVGNCWGFVGNRLVVHYNSRSHQLLGLGLTPEEVDGALVKFGMRMGCLAKDDLVGLDLGIQGHKAAGTWLPQTNLQHRLVEHGRLGQKNLKGFFDYDDKRNATPSAEAMSIIKQFAADNAIAPKSFTEEEIIQWCFFPMINEGFKCLSEGIAQRPSDIDVCYCHGYAFPRNKGGPMYYADQVGLPKVKAVLESMGVEVAPLLAECVAAGKSLAEVWAAKLPRSKL